MTRMWPKHLTGALAATLLLAGVARPAAADPRRTVLHEFAGAAEGFGSDVGLAVGAGGGVYGVSSTGGTNGACQRHGCGYVFRLTRPAGSVPPWTFEVLHAFTPGDGGNLPVHATPAIGPDGALYGTAEHGGGGGAGVVWRLAPPAVAGGPWVYGVLHAFHPDRPDQGVFPASGVVMDAGGTLYGLAQGGATNNGVVFALAPPATPGGDWVERVLHDLPAPTIPGGATVLSAGVVLSPDQDDLFGAYGVSAPSAAARSYVFGLHRGGSGWTSSVVHEFPAYGDFSPLLVDANRNVFGIFFQYGASLNESGAVFELSPPGAAGGAWSERDVFSYDYHQVVYGNLAQGAKGELFGTIGLTFGQPPDAIFRLDPPAGAGGGAWSYSILRTFARQSLLGRAPLVPTSLARDPGGNLVGVTLYGGERDRGVVFRQEVRDHSAPSAAPLAAR